MAINLLPSEIYNKISAGEVVEKPASVVKELVENSIDGGANKISVEIFDGGIKKIIVSDNGCGISPEDVEKAFLPHATSKIAKEDDLYSISSLGFRGEALASIAAVSKVEMLTKTDDNEFGISLKIEGGILGEKHEIGYETGTRIIVKDLFFNTPARLKFLRKPKTEENEITNLIAKIIMANPQISFRYCVDDKIIYNTFGNGLAEAMYIIYGKETYNNLLEVNYERDGVNVFGYIARPTFSKPNRTYQTLFVNGRVVTNYMVSSAVQDAVDAYIMKGKFPLFALNITLPFESVDVNVHPSKQEVKFEQPNKIYSIVNNAIYKAVSNANYVQETQLENVSFNELEKKEIAKEIDEENKNYYYNLIKNSKENSNINHDINLKSSDNLISKIISENYLYNFNKNQENSYKITENYEKNQENKKNKFKDFKFEEIEIKSENNLKNEKINENKHQIQNKLEEVFDNYKIIGVLFETYILIEKDNSFFVIDQHAAHERQLYDKLQAQINESKIPSQQLLIPFILSTNLKETQFLEENLKTLIEFGIDISQFGENSFKISSVPTILEQINLKDFFDEILKDVSSYLKKPVAFIKDKIARTACRAAVKAGNKLSEGEITILINNFKENKNVLLCPHGRPIVVEFKKSEIEKWFKRIV